MYNLATRRQARTPAQGLIPTLPSASADSMRVRGFARDHPQGLPMKKSAQIPSLAVGTLLILGARAQAVVPAGVAP